MSADRTPPADMSGYDRAVRTAKVSGNYELSEFEYRLVLATIAAAAVLIVAAVWAFA